MPAGLDLPRAELLENRPEPFWWQRRWAALSQSARRLVAVLTAVLLVAAAAVWLVDRADDRALRQRVVLATSLGVWVSSSSPPGGEIGYFLLVRNDGALPVSVTSVQAAGDRLRLRLRDDGVRLIPPAGEVQIPMSVRLTCADTTHDARLRVVLRVRREDGAPVTQRGELQPAALLLDVAATLCGVRPELRDHELSGPVLDGRPGGD